MNGEIKTSGKHEVWFDDHLLGTTGSVIEVHGVNKDDSLLQSQPTAPVFSTKAEVTRQPVKHCPFCGSTQLRSLQEWIICEVCRKKYLIQHARQLRKKAVTEGANDES